MHTVTIRDAKARLNALVDAAERGEQVVLMRGSRMVAAIVPVSPDDFELVPRLSDPQAERLWKQIEGERTSGESLVFDGPAEAVAHMSSTLRTSAGRRRASGRASRTPPRAR
jgi:prevent-host-death family protein